MKNRLLSLLLACALVLGMLPVAALAEEAERITVTAGDASYTASYVGTGGKSLGQEGGVYALQIPGVMDISVAKETATGGVAAGNVSGSVLAEFPSYPVELSEADVSAFVLSAEELAGCTDVGIDFTGGDWACVILTEADGSRDYLFMLLGESPAAAVDATELTVTDNVIDITDKTVGTIASYYGKATTLTVSGATVVGATEDGTTINVVLDGSTSADAEVSVEFGTSLNKFTMEGTTGSVTLVDGTGTLSTTLNAKYNGRMSRGTATYTINFTVDVVPTEVPTRILDSGSAATYTGVALDINLKDFFINASAYYLVEGETLTALEGKTYRFVTSEGGDYTLTFAASNVVGTCPDYATVTVKVTEIESGAWIGYETSNGSVDYVLFTDANGDPIDGLTATYADNAINVVLPQSFDAAGTVTATFSRTANDSDIPYLTSSNSFNGAYNARKDVYTTTLSNGAGTATMYLYNLKPGATSNTYETWKINYKVYNNIPTFAEGAASSDEQTITALESSYEVDLSKLFVDPDGQDLTYKVSINGGDYTVCDASYTHSTGVAGTYTLAFKANDGMDDSEDTYTVTLTVKNSTTTYAVPVTVADGVEGLTFYADSLSGEALSYADGIVQVPANVTQIWWNTTDGMNGTASVSDGAELKLQLTTIVVKTALGDEDTAATVTVTDPDGNTISGSGYTYLLDSGEGYTFKAAPSSTYSSAWSAVTLSNQTVTTDSSATVTITLEVKSAKTITVDKGAEVKVYYQSTYFVLTEVQPVFGTDNGDTITYTYSCPNETTYAKGYMYFAKKDGFIDKAGYLGDVTDATVTWAEESRTGSYRGSYDVSTDYGARGDDSVFVNVNSKGHLVLNAGDTFRLRAFRMWEIIDSDTTNVMIEPEFIYTRYGSDILSLSQVTDKVCGTSGNNWVDMTATDSGVAFLEVGYEAVHIVDGYESGAFGGASGQTSNFTYNASDPNRTALIVVQTDGNAATDVSFGITNSYGGTWDAEFDTLYIVGASRALTFTPTATSGSIASVAVSANKGSSWTALTADENGAYTADIYPGSNVIRVTKADGTTAYQVVRGDSVTYTITNVTEGKSADDAIVAGDTVRVTLQGLHAPLGKISGIYNGNAHQIAYSWNGATVMQSEYSGYNLPTNAWIEVTIPEDAENYTLTGGYVTFSSYGSNFGAHRSLTDSGVGQNTVAEKKYGNLAVLPDIEIPVVLPATYTVTMPEESETYTITVSDGSESPVAEGGSFSFTVTVAEGYDGTNMVVMANDTQLTGVDGIYTIENITADQTITVTGVVKAVTYGDLNEDGAVNAADAALAYAIANGTKTATSTQLTAADVNGDGTINAADAALIYAYANGVRTSFPVEAN